MENKDTWTWQFPRFQVFQALHSKESWCVGMDRAIVAGPMDSCSSPEYRGHSGGPVDISILGRGGWNLEAEEHLALLPSTCTFLGVLWLPGCLKWLQIRCDPEGKSLKGDCDVCACVVSLSCQLLERPCQVTTVGVTRLLESTYFNFASPA